MHRATFSLALLAAAPLLGGGAPAWAAKAKTPVTSKAKHLEMSPQELRIRVRGLIRPTLGIVGQAAERSLRESSDPAIRKGTIVWEIEGTTTLLTAMLRTDPVLALGDAWGYAFQVESYLAQADVAESFGMSASDASAAMALIRSKFRAFVVSVQDEAGAAKLEDAVQRWAERNPIDGDLSRRTSVEPEFARALSESSGGGVFSALSGLEETTADVMMRMDLYTVYLPRLARREAELAAFDLSKDADPKTFVEAVDRLSRAADRIATVADGMSELVARERGATLDAVRVERLAATRDLQGERKVIVDAIHRERIESLQEVELIAQRLLDGMGGPLNAAVRTDLEDLVKAVELMRKRLIDDMEPSMTRVVDHTFRRLIQLLLITTVLGILCLFVYARFLRRAGSP